jgi:hypothetical protein
MGQKVQRSETEFDKVNVNRKLQGVGVVEQDQEGKVPTSLIWGERNQSDEFLPRETRLKFACWV